VRKDKAGKKDKLKHLDLFEMMLNQSQVFRDMVEHFQSTWVPRIPSVVVEADMTTRNPTEKRAKAAKDTPVTKPTKSHAAWKPVASAKPVPNAVVPNAVKHSPSKSPSKAKQSKPVTPRKTAGKAAAARRVAKRK